MANFWLKIKIWTKVIVSVLLLLYIIIFAAVNQSHEAKVWVWFNKEVGTSVLLVAVISFVAGVIGTILLRTTLRTARQVKELQERTRSAKLERAVQEMQAKAAMLRAKPPPGTEAPVVEPHEEDEGVSG